MSKKKSGKPWSYVKRRKAAVLVGAGLAALKGVVGAAGGMAAKAVASKAGLMMFANPKMRASVKRPLPRRVDLARRRRVEAAMKATPLSIRRIAGAETGGKRAQFYRTRIASPKEFHPASFHTIAPGTGRHKMVVGCPLAHPYVAGRCRDGTEVQSVLVRKRALAALPARRRVAANPLLMIVPNGLQSHVSGYLSGVLGVQGYIEPEPGDDGIYDVVVESGDSEVVAKALGKDVLTKDCLFQVIGPSGVSKVYRGKTPLFRKNPNRRRNPLLMVVPNDGKLKTIRPGVRVYTFKRPATARAHALRLGVPILHGEHPWFWVPLTKQIAKVLIQDGYEPAEWPQEKYMPNSLVHRARELSVPEKHQLKIALSTLRMTPQMALVMGGPSPEEAKAFLRSIGYSEQKITQLASNPGLAPFSGKVGSILSSENKEHGFYGTILHWVEDKPRLNAKDVADEVWTHAMLTIIKDRKFSQPEAVLWLDSTTGRHFADAVIDNAGGSKNAQALAKGFNATWPKWSKWVAADLRKWGYGRVGMNPGGGYHRRAAKEATRLSQELSLRRYNIQDPVALAKMQREMYELKGAHKAHFQSARDSAIGSNPGPYYEAKYRTPRVGPWMFSPVFTDRKQAAHEVKRLRVMGYVARVMNIPDANQWFVAYHPAPGKSPQTNPLTPAEHGEMAAKAENALRAWVVAHPQLAQRRLGLVRNLPSFPKHILSILRPSAPANWMKRPVKDLLIGKNPDPAWHKAHVEEYGGRYAGDVKAGHKKAAEYWKGALAAEAAAVAAGNPGACIASNCPKICALREIDKTGKTAKVSGWTIPAAVAKAFLHFYDGQTDKGKKYLERLPVPKMMLAACKNAKA